MIQFERPQILYFLIIVPVFLIWSYFRQRKKWKQIASLYSAEVLESIMPEYSKKRPKFKFWLIAWAMVFFIIGLANPQIGSKLKEMKSKGVEMIIALDVSNSMMAEDIKPNRLKKAKRTIYQMIDKLHGDKVGLIVFAGQAFVQMPSTTDYRAAKMFLNSINPGIIPVQGTAIGEAIELGVRSFSEKNEKNKVLVIITDGENHEEGAITAAKEAAEKGIHIFTIGMGLPKGTPIPQKDKYGRKDYKRDQNGQIVITKLDEQFLQKVAVSGDGKYLSALQINTLLDEIKKMDKQEFESRIYSDYEDRFQYFFAIAFVLLLMEILILNKKNIRLSKYNVFQTNNKK